MFVLAIVDDFGTIYSLHSKIYFNQKQAKNALIKMIENEKINKDMKVYEMPFLHLNEID